MTATRGREDVSVHAGLGGSTLPRCADAVVIGAGPVGCVTALALADRGAEVLLLEAHPFAARRLAGEWLHPPAAQLLGRLNVRAFDTNSAISANRRGFVVLSDHAEEAIRLDYTEGARGLSCEHSVLVDALRDTVSAHTNVTFVPFAHVTGIDTQQVSVENERTGETIEVLAERVVAASGRSALAREWLDADESPTTVSYTAGVILEDAELPFEDYGHVILGGPGPVLAYRLDDRRLRICLDVPLHHVDSRAASGYLWAAYGQALPLRLQPAFRRVLETQPIMWAANRVRPRRTYGRDGLVFVGDAVGHFHPLTAVGITLGFGDAECVARSKNFGAYRRERSSRTRVAELLASALYAVFTRRDEASIALRQAIYDMWLRGPEQRSRTMRFLSTEDTSPVHFSRTFLEVMTGALRGTVGHAVATRRWGPTSEVLQGYAAWLQWLGRAALFSPALPPPLVPVSASAVEPAACP